MHICNMCNLIILQHTYSVCIMCIIICTVDTQTQFVHTHKQNYKLFGWNKAKGLIGGHMWCVWLFDSNYSLMMTSFYDVKLNDYLFMCIHRLCIGLVWYDIARHGSPFVLPTRDYPYICNMKCDTFEIQFVFTWLSFILSHLHF